MGQFKTLGKISGVLTKLSGILSGVVVRVSDEGTLPVTGKLAP